MQVFAAVASRSQGVHVKKSDCPRRNVLRAFGATNSNVGNSYFDFIFVNRANTSRDRYIRIRY